MERNLCSESGCKAHCCFSPQIPIIGGRREDILRWFPGAVEVSSQLRFLFKPIRGVNFIKQPDRYLIGMDGYCPNLDENFNCKIQDDKPPACTEFVRGLDGCTAARLENGIVPFRKWGFERSVNGS